MNMLDAFNADIVAQFQHRGEPKPAHRAKYRGTVRKEVLGCESCELHRHGTPVPFDVPTGADVKFVVLLEAPPARNAPEIKLLKALMREVKIDPVNDVLWTHVVNCVPETEGVARAASPSETQACRRHLFNQIEAAYAPFVLLVGAKAVDAWRSDISVTHHHGSFFVWGDLHVCMPLVHPAAGLRDRTFKRAITDDLARWRDVIYSGDNPLLHLGETCVKCRADAAMWDRDGVPYCTQHYAKWKDQWRKERLRWKLPTAVQLELI